MQIFEKLITVSQDDLDELNHVNNVRYVQWAQDIAKEHWLKYATEEILNDFFWVLLNHHIEYKSPTVLNDVVRLKTYIIKTKGVTSTRVVEMFNNKTNKLLVKSETHWCFMNSKTLRPTRINSEIANLFN